MISVNELPLDWADAMEAVLSAPSSRTLVLGPRDAGKSSFCRALLEAAQLRALRLSLLDTDVAQKLIGPPAAVTLVEAGAAEALAGLAFIGTTNPLRGFRAVVDAVQRLTAAAADRLVVNTSGLLAPAGRRLKSEKIEALRPDLLIAIGRDPGLDAVLSDHATIPTRRLRPSPLARRKTEAERRGARQKAFARYFEGASLSPFAPPDIGSEGGAGVAPGLLVGLADANGRDLAMGIVRAVEPSRLLVEAPPAGLPASGVKLGRIRLDADYRELPIELASAA